MDVCKKLKPLLFRFINSQLSEKDEQFVNKHVESCAKCKKAYDRLLKLKLLLKTQKAQMDKLPKMFKEQLELQLLKVRIEKKPKKSILPKVIIFMIALIVIMIGAYILFKY